MKILESPLSVISVLTLVPVLFGLNLSTAQQQQANQFGIGNSTISGHVTALDSGRPISGASIEIIVYEGRSARFRQSTSDKDGKFEFSKLPAGKYQLAAQATRYIRMQFGQERPGPTSLLNPAQIIELKEGEAFERADFRLSGYAAVEGNVVDEFGDPVPNASIQVSEIQYLGGRRRLMPASTAADAGPRRLTDDVGHFRIAGLPPGDYFVEAVTGAFADAGAISGFAITYYPGTVRASEAKTIHLSAAQEMSGISFALSPGPGSTVEGVVVDPEGKTVPGVSLLLVPSERSSVALFITGRTTSGRDGVYALGRVPPGTYTIQALQQLSAPVAGGPRFLFGYSTFTVDGRDLRPITVNLAYPRVVRGRIKFEGDPSAVPKPGELALSTVPVDFETSPVLGAPTPAAIREDWTFEIGGLTGRRVITATSRVGWSLRAISVGGSDVTDRPLELENQDVNDVEVVFTQTFTSVTGTLKNAKGDPVPDTNVVVFVNDESKWTMWSRYVAFSRVGSQGTFTIRGLPPGNYIAVPRTTLTPGEWQDAEFLRQLRLEPNAQHFTLTERSSATVAITVK